MSATTSSTRRLSAAASSPLREPPSDLPVRLARGVTVHDGGRLLLGGSPSRLVRLKDGGAAVVAAWRSGAPIGEGRAARALARRLLDAGVLVPDPAAGATADVAVVVPTHGRADQLARCLGSIAATAPDATLLVVDDGSPDPSAILAVASEHGATVVRHPSSRGPSAARNTGLAHTDRPLVAFVDSDVVVLPGCLARLAGHFADPAIGAVAPRVLAVEHDGGMIASYEQRHSALDMGAHASRVRPGAPVPYVPSATLAVRREAFGHGFDTALTIGEDVDLVWRIDAAGWGVQYDPSVAVRHDHRTGARELAGRRFAYATSIGLLAARHPYALAALRLDGATAVVGLILLPRPVLAALLAGRLAWRTRTLLAGRTAQPTILAARLTAQAVSRGALSASHAARRPWWPLLALAARRHRRARVVLALALATGVVQARPKSPLHAALVVSDDLISGAGTWWSCLRCRTVRPLLPSRR